MESDDEWLRPLLRDYLFPWGAGLAVFSAALILLLPWSVWLLFAAGLVALVVAVVRLRGRRA